jgi:hypothetical protein
MTATP